MGKDEGLWWNWDRRSGLGQGLSRGPRYDEGTTVETEPRETWVHVYLKLFRVVRKGETLSQRMGILILEPTGSEVLEKIQVPGDLSQVQMSYRDSWHTRNPHVSTTLPRDRRSTCGRDGRVITVDRKTYTPVRPVNTTVGRVVPISGNPDVLLDSKVN